MEGERVGGAVVDDVESAKREEEELLGIKLRKGIAVGKRGGPFTPVPSWKMDPGPGPSLSNPSARKLGASLWEAQELLPPLSNSTKLSRIKSTTMRAHRLHHLSDASEPSSPTRDVMHGTHIHDGTTGLSHQDGECLVYVMSIYRDTSDTGPCSTS